MKLHGGLLEDRDEYLLYAANNIYADIPFVYTGPIDPWFSLQDGLTYGGDARNNTFLRMMVDARQSSNSVPALAHEATRVLREALAVQTQVADNLIQTGPLSFFARSDSLMQADAVRLLAQESAGLTERQLPSIFSTLTAQLFEDDAYPDYGRYPGSAPQTQEAMTAWQEMTAGIEQARQSAEANM
jgi:hypothetical protein